MKNNCCFQLQKKNDLTKLNVVCLLVILCSAPFSQTLKFVTLGWIHSFLSNQTCHRCLLSIPFIVPIKLSFSIGKKWVVFNRIKLPFRIIWLLEKNEAKTIQQTSSCLLPAATLGCFKSTQSLKSQALVTKYIESLSHLKFFLRQKHSLNIYVHSRVRK